MVRREANNFQSLFNFSDLSSNGLLEKVYDSVRDSGLKICGKFSTGNKTALIRVQISGCPAEVFPSLWVTLGTFFQFRKQGLTKGDNFDSGNVNVAVLLNKIVVRGFVSEVTDVILRITLLKFIKVDPARGGPRTQVTDNGFTNRAAIVTFDIFVADCRRRLLCIF